MLLTELFLLQKYVDVLTSSTSEMTLFENRVIASKISQVKRRLYWGRMGPESVMTGILIRRGQERHT